MSELSREDIAEDFKVPVWVCWEATLGLDSVFIEDAERAEMSEIGVVPWRELVLVAL